MLEPVSIEAHSPREMPLRRKLLYGTSRIGSEALGRSGGLWLLYYYAPPQDAHLPTLLPSVAVGALLTVGGIVGALDEAIVGYFSDRTRSRWGRRIPYIVVGPYEALLPEMASTSEERVGLQAVKVYLGVCGTAIGLVGSDFLVDNVG